MSKIDVSLTIICQFIVVMSYFNKTLTVCTLIQKSVKWYLEHSPS